MHLNNCDNIKAINEIKELEKTKVSNELNETKLLF
jgi:hypothetical protein